MVIQVNWPIGCLLLVHLMGQYCFARYRLSSSVVVCNAAGGRAGQPPDVWAVGRPLGAWAVGRPTLHAGPVRLRLVKATPYCTGCYYIT